MLYHFTNLHSFIEIFSNSIVLKTMKPYISFTRNFDMISPELRPDKYSVRIVLDKKKIVNNHKLKPFLDSDYVNRLDNEMEEIIEKEKINIGEYITEVNIMDKPLLNHNIKHHYFGDNIYSETKEEIFINYNKKLEIIKKK